MKDLITIITLICLFFIFIQDIKFRHIHFIFPTTIFIGSCFLLLKKGDYFIIISNVIFFLTTLSLLVLYMSLKSKRFINPFISYFGIGDLIFYLSITPVFFLNNYVLFFILSMFFSLAMQYIINKKPKEKTIPLAGFASLLLILIIIRDLIVAPNSFTTF